MAEYVISGDYKGKLVWTDIEDRLWIQLDFFGKKKVYITKENVIYCKLLSISDEPSFTSVMIGSTIGGALFGEAGELLGALTADVNREYRVEIHFNDGKKCIMQLSDLEYNALVKILT